MNLAAYRAQLQQAVSATGAQLPDYFLDALCSEFIANGAGAGREPAADARIAADLWDLLVSKEPAATCVEARRDGMQTRLYVMLPDMPFITDSVLMDLTRHDIAITFLLNLTVTIHRDGNGCPAAAAVDSNHTKDTIIYLELDPLPDADRQELIERINHALSDVQVAVADYGPMQDRVRECISQMRRSGVSGADQAIEYLEWLLDNHFTFLGYREFDYDGGMIQQVEGTALGTMRNRRAASRRVIADLAPAVRAFLQEPTLIVFSKSGTRSRVHRPAYPDYIGVKHMSEQGEVAGEHGFYGLFTSPVYTEHPKNIPYLRDKTQAVLDRAGLDPHGFDGKNLAQILTTFPRDELFQIGVDELYHTAMAISHIHERRITKLFVRQVRYGLFWTCLVYVPREVYNTRLRVALEELFCQRFAALDVEFDAKFSESILVRLQFTLRVDPEAVLTIDVPALEAEVVELAQDWHHSLKRALRAADEWRELQPLFHHLPAECDDAMTSGEAHAALRALASLDDNRPVHIELLDADEALQLRFLCRGVAISLSAVMPMLEHFGFEVRRERSMPFSDGRHVIYQYQVTHPGIAAAAGFDESLLIEALVGIVTGAVVDDPFNQLIVSIGVSWREVSVVRAYAAYLKQAGFGFDVGFLTATLNRHPQVTRALIEHFLARFDPALDEVPQLDVTALLSSIELINEDRAFRKLFGLVEATVRTNFFRRTDGDVPGHLAFKLIPRRIEGLPRPLPAVETFVFGPAVEGVHLRSSPIARGGIRWSDRSEDYRTEVLDLMKTQVVKNALIVPSGAKGGFLVKDHQIAPQPGLACYRLFIGCLLDITDNIVSGGIVPPAGVRRYDDDDPYLVVAADKGTATFSDEANALAQQREFWLADAFASGGRTGYDHKQMGITARGAWRSVIHHLHRRGIDPQRDPITVVGIGDMSGDVFGNGLLSSRTIRLLAAFNHRHIFLDPNPDPEASFDERKRLFDAVLGWDGYDRTLISAGGGIYERTTKSITVTPEVAAVLNLDAAAVSPDEMISAILRAEATLLWNGGVGTYVKASWERHGDVGDRANDDVRVDATALRCAVVGEGGNLGMTQAARVEFARCGGAVNADFIDNSAGVDCSDHEVNLKVLLNAELSAGRLDLAERDALLRRHEDDVAELVLANNDRQAAALTQAEAEAAAYPEAYARLMEQLEAAGVLDRSLHALPSREALQERTEAGAGLTRPELAVLMCCAKISLKAAFTAIPVRDTALMSEVVAREFPAAISARFEQQLPEHPLATQIAATLLVNQIVDQLGMLFMHRLLDMTAADAHEVVHAFLATDALLGTGSAVESLQAAPMREQDRGRAILRQIDLAVQATAWFAHHYARAIGVSELVQRFKAPIEEVMALPAHAYLTEPHLQRVAAERSDVQAPGVAGASGSAQLTVLRIARLVAEQSVPAQAAAAAWRQVDSTLQIGALIDAMHTAPVNGHWEQMELYAACQQLMDLQYELALDHLHGRKPALQLDAFAAAWQRTVNSYLAGEVQSPAFAALTVRKLATLFASTRQN